MQEKEEARLGINNIERLNTKWAFKGFAAFDVKVVLVRQPLVGTGSLPDWPRKLALGSSIVALDTYKDNLCLWRCIEVHRRVRPNRSTRAARGFARSFLKLKAIPKTSLDELEKIEKHYIYQGQAFEYWLGIRVYESERQKESVVVWQLKRSLPAKLTDVMTIDIYDGHAFLIKTIEKLAKVYKRSHCHARFTRNNNLQHHNETCARGETVIHCPAQKVEAPQTAIERAAPPTIR